MKRLFVLLALAGAASWSCGTTVFRNERFACERTGDCADGFVCSAGECRTGEVEVDAGMTRTDGGAGSRCSAANDCVAALICVEGVCCQTPCNSPCDSCALPGFEGTCRPSPAGTAASGCGGYACDGTSVACSNACNPTAGVNTCNPGYTCVSTTCGRCWSSVKTGFELENDPAWVLGAADITGGSLVIAVTSRNSMGAGTTATSSETLPLVGCGVTIELATAPSVVAGYQARMGLRAAASSRRPSFEWQLDTRGVVATWALADGGVGEQVVVPAGTTPPRWLRIEEAGGEVLWRATNASTFTTLHALPHAESLTGMKLEFSGQFQPQGGNQRVSFSIDSINDGP